MWHVVSCCRLAMSPGPPVLGGAKDVGAPSPAPLAAAALAVAAAAAVAWAILHQ